MDLISRVRRKTQSGSYIAAIDGLRFVFIAMVVMFHLNGYVAEKMYGTAPDSTTNGRLTYQVLAHGHWGVQAFFVLSGFVIALPFMRHAVAVGPKIRLKQYFLRRLTRLEPPYVLALMLIALGLVATKPDAATDLWKHLAASIVYLHGAVYSVPSTITVVAWSLEVEIQFYVLAPIIALVFRVGAARRIILGAAIVGLSLLSEDVLAQLNLTVIPHLPYFLTGMLVADLYLIRQRKIPSSRLKFDLVLVAALCALGLAWAERLPRITIPPLLGVSMFSALHSRIALRALSSPWISGIGGMCYSLYLLHYPAISAIGRITGPLVRTGHYTLDVAVQSLVVLPFVLLVGGTFFVLIERPCMDPTWPNALARSLRRIAWRNRPPAAEPPLS